MPQRFVTDRLHVIMGVEKDRGLVRAGVKPIGIDDRITVSGQLLRIVQSDASHLRGDPIGAGLQLRLKGGVLADGWEAEQRLKAVTVGNLIPPRLCQGRVYSLIIHHLSRSNPSALVACLQS